MHTGASIVNLGRASYYCQLELILSTIVDPLSPHMHITQTLANKHEVTSAPPEGTELRPFKSAMEQGSIMTELATQFADLEACVAELGTKEARKPIRLGGCVLSRLRAL